MCPELLESIKSLLDAVDVTAKSFDTSTLFAGLSPDDKVGRLRDFATSKGMKTDAFDAAHRHWRVVATLGGYPETVTDYVALYTERHALTARFNGLLDMPRTSQVASYPNVGDLERDLRLLSAKLRLPYGDKAISDAVGQWLGTAKLRRLESAFSTIVVPDPVNADAEWESFVHALVDTSAVTTNYAAGSFKAFIWQVKRKIADDPTYPVYDHVMPVLTGPQGSGKTQAVEMLLGPIRDLVAPTNFQEITDGKNFDLWNFPALFLDEMEKAGNSDWEGIKNAITRSTKSGRILYTNNTGTIRVLSTLIGCTNGTLGDKIADTTGLRRFAPIPAKHRPTPENIAAGLPVVDWKALNEVDHVKLWQSVDHTAAHPLSANDDVRAEWAAQCEAERQQDSVEAWLRQIDRDLIHLTADKPHTTGDLYGYGDGKGYRDWCQRNGYSPVSAAKLGRRMKSLSAMPWYPFEAPKDGKRGTLHVLHEPVKLAA